MNVFSLAWYWAIASGLKCVACRTDSNSDLYVCVVPRRFIPNVNSFGIPSIVQIEFISSKVDTQWGMIGDEMREEFLSLESTLPHKSDWPERKWSNHATD